MLHLRLTHRVVEENWHHVEISLEGGGAARQTAESTFSFSLSPQDEEDLRWYLEDYLQFPQDPAPVIAQRIEERLAQVGTDLFRAAFHASDDARDLWASVRARLFETRIEIVTGVSEGNTLPWELLRDPKTDTPLALSACSFVRAQPTAARRPYLPDKKKGKIRILLVICRPGGGRDVPFRSVASRLIKGLDEANREAYDLDVLRPPTFEQLGRVLRRAKQEGRPYHVVHFDGHGTYREIKDFGALANVLNRLSSVVLAGWRRGRHGYLLFENPQFGENTEPVDGTSLGKLLAEAQVPVLVLNACRSAHAEPPVRPGSAADIHSQVRAFGSLAQEVMDSGAAGVVAMSYNVYVVTAAQMVAELYGALGRGSTLGEAVTLARKNLADNPWREVAFDPLPLQDWPVPVVYEAAPLQVFLKVKGGDGIQIRLAAGASAKAGGGLDPALPPAPDVGFYGRDETLLSLDRAFDRDNVVLLHAYAGSGKTATAAEFARWYALTGGLDGPVLFTSFEYYLPLSGVLDRIGQVFGQPLEEVGIHWLALDEAKRREVALQVLAQVPVLWIWDNVEAITGFPAGGESAWKYQEQGEIVAFLRAARGTKAKFLLTSRQDERSWLGDLPTRISMPPMPMTECLQLARALAAKEGRRLSEVEDWRPLLAFAHGNPLTLTVLVGQVLRERLATKQQIEGFIARLRSGEATFTDEPNEGRSRSLGASLAYGFEHAFTEEERRKLAVLHVFQGFVNVLTLSLLSEPEASWRLPGEPSLTLEEATTLLNRAAQVGLLTAYDGGYYSIHPALPWFFRDLFEYNYPERRVILRAFVGAENIVGSLLHSEYQEGNIHVLSSLRVEEANLLEARRLALAHGWREDAIGAMQGLSTLYDHTGRRAEWKRLVEEIVSYFIDAASDGPLPGLEEEWEVVMQYRVLLAREERRWAEAIRLQEMVVDQVRRRAAPFLTQPPEALDTEKQNTIRSLAVSLGTLGNLLQHADHKDCIRVFEESLELSEHIADQAGAATWAFNLGNAFKNLSDYRDLKKSERWYRRSLDLTDERDPLRRGKCLGQLGYVALELFYEARKTGLPEAEVLGRLEEAARLYYEALQLTPPDSIEDLAFIQHRLGLIYFEQGDYNLGLEHTRQAIRYHEMQGNFYEAAQSRCNMASAFLLTGRLPDALIYAKYALQEFESLGSEAAEMAEKTRQLIANISAAAHR